MIHSRFRFALLLALATGLVGSAFVTGHKNPTGRVIYNLDSSEFYVGTFGPVEPETIERFVDEHAALGVTDLFVNVNHKRTNYASEVWDAGWTDLDPDSVGVEWIRNQRLFHDKGYDYPSLMLQRARKRGIGAWISIRMNDAHLPDEPEHPLHSSFWRSHPEWWLSNGGVDFEVPEVREHYLRLIREVCERYNIDGLELDFLRFQFYFRPGREAIGAPMMTRLVEEVRIAVDEAADRLDHPVYLGVRAPTSPDVSRAHGLAAVAWARQGLVDLIVATPWWTSANSDMPIEMWKEEMKGTTTEVALAIEEGVNSGGLPRRTMTSEEMRGIFFSGWSRGADAMYFFNLFTNPIRFWPKEEYDAIVRDAGSPERLYAAPRRHVLTIADPWSPTDPMARQVLPSSGRDMLLKLHIGRAPREYRDTRVELVMDNPEMDPRVEVNGKVATFSGRVEPKHLEEVGLNPKLEPARWIYTFPWTQLQDGYNEIRIEAKEDVIVRWAEISIGPMSPD